MLYNADWCSAGAEEYKFDASEFEKKTVEFSGYFEQKEEGLKLRSDRRPTRWRIPGVAASRRAVAQYQHGGARRQTES